MMSHFGDPALSVGAVFAAVSLPHERARRVPSGGRVAAKAPRVDQRSHRQGVRERGAKVAKGAIVLRIVDQKLQYEKAHADKELIATKNATAHATAKERRKHMPAMLARKRRAEAEFERVDGLLD